MSTPVTATYSFEIELELSGRYFRAQPATSPSYSSGGDPPEPEMVEDIEILDIGLVSYDPSRPSPRWTTQSLLEGIPKNSPDITKLFSNLLALIETEAQEALIEAQRAGEP